MQELEQYLENELQLLRLKLDDWDILTIKDTSRKETLLEIQSLIKKIKDKIPPLK